MNDTTPEQFAGWRRDAEVQRSPITGRGEYLGEQDVSLKQSDAWALWSAVYRNRWLVLLVVAIALAIGLAVTVLSTRVYEARATVQVDQQATRVLEGDDVQPLAQTANEARYLETQVDILKSRSMAERVEESLKLSTNNQFLTAMGLDPSAEVPAAARKQQVVGLLRGGLDVETERDSRIASIVFSSVDPVWSARIANSFAQNFIIGNLQRKYDASSYARDFLQKQIRDTKERLEASERAVIAYARSARLIDTGSGNTSDAGDASSAGRSLTTSNLVALNSALATATTARVAAEQRWAQARATPLMSLAEVQSNGAVQSLVQQRASLTAEYEEERQRRREDYPTVKQAAARIGELTRQINQLANNVRDTIRDQYVVAQNQENALKQRLGQLQGATLNEQDRGVRYNILRREADTNRAAYAGLLQRFQQLNAAAGITANNLSIVDTASVPGGPSYPKPFLNMALAALGGLVLAVGLVFARETFDDVIRLPEDVSRKLSVPFLGTIPTLPAGVTADEAFRDQRSRFSEAYYALRSTLQFSTPAGVPRSLVLSSSLQGEGKSTTSVSLAKSFARINKRVLLIDGDLRKPSLHRWMQTANVAGFSNLLTGQSGAEELVLETETPNLSFMPCGPLPPNPGELLARADLRAIVAKLTESYDLVLIDGPPVMGFADAPIYASVVGGAVFAIEAGRAHGGQAKVALRRLREGHGNLLGVVLTKFDAATSGYGASYGYGYEYSYGTEPAAEETSSRGFNAPA